MKLLLHNFSFKNNKIVLIAHSMIFFLCHNQKVSKLFTFSAQINISYNNEKKLCLLYLSNFYDEKPWNQNHAKTNCFVTYIVHKNKIPSLYIKLRYWFNSTIFDTALNHIIKQFKGSNNKMCSHDNLSICHLHLCDNKSYSGRSTFCELLVCIFYIDE